MMGVDNDPLYYLISQDQPAGWVPQNAFEQRMYQLTHTGDMYNRGGDGIEKYPQGLSKHLFIGMDP